MQWAIEIRGLYQPVITLVPFTLPGTSLAAITVNT
jgi:hypothetical protein